MDNIRQDLETANQAFMDAFNTGDAAHLSRLYTGDGQVLPPNGEIVTGFEQLRSFWQSVMDMGIKSVELKIDEVMACGDAAVEISRATVTGENGSVLDKVKYIVIWKRADGAWKLHRDIFNSSRAPA